MLLKYRLQWNSTLL